MGWYAELQIKRLKVLMFLLFIQENVCCEYSLVAPDWDASHEYLQHVFDVDTPSYVELWYTQVYLSPIIRPNIWLSNSNNSILFIC